MDMDPVYKFGGTHNESKTSKMAADNLASDEKLMPKKTQGLSPLDHHRLLQITKDDSKSHSIHQVKTHTPDPRIQLTWMSLNTSEGSVRQFLR
jgi:hypothetical protein